MELYDHLRKISFGFFLIMGLAHFLAGLMFIKGYDLPASMLINRVTFIPFALSALALGFANIKCALLDSGKSSHVQDYAFIALGSVIFLALLAAELFVADATTPLIP